MRTLLFTVAVAVAAMAADARAERMTPELLWKLGRVANPQPSPDGKWVLFEVTTYDLAKNAGNSDVWLVPAAGGDARRLTASEKGDSGARWSPDGKLVGFLSSRDGKPQVYTIDPTGGEARKLTDVKEGVANFAWSPDGGHVSFTSEVRIDQLLKDVYPDLPKAEARIIDTLLYRHWDSWYEGTYAHLMVMPAAGGDVVDLMKDQRVSTPLVPFGDAAEIAWSPDGRELCYTAKIVDDPAESTDSDLYVVPVSGGEARCLTDGMDGFDRAPLYSPDGKWIAFHSMERATFEADRNRIMLIDRANGGMRELTQGFAHSAGDMAWTPDAKAVLFTAAVEGTIQLFRAELDGGVTQVTQGRHDLSNVAAAPGGKVAFARRSTMERPHEVVRVDLASGELTAITDVNGAIYASLELPIVEAKWVESTDGARVHCWVIKPPGFDPAVRYPLLTYCQGGPQSPITQWFSYTWNFHLMAARGYVVVAPNRRGLPGFGQAWNDAISRDWGGQAMQDYLAATDAMFAEPWIDRERAAAIGASFGGYSVYWLMGHDQEDRFCTMVAHCGLFNLESWYGTTEELWFANWDLGGPYWTSDELRTEYERNSPHRFIGAWDTPLLVIHGEKDFRVPVAEGMQAFTAAKLQGVPARFLYFPGEGHWVGGVQNGVLWQRVFYDWLDRTCKPQG